MATMAVHLAAEGGHVEAFEMLWKLRRTDGSVSLLFLLSDRRGKRALERMPRGLPLLRALRRGLLLGRAGK